MSILVTGAAASSARGDAEGFWPGAIGDAASTT